MAEEIDFENVRMSNFYRHVTLTLTLDRAYDIPSCITHRPLSTNQISFELEKRFVHGRKYRRTDSAIFPEWDLHYIWKMKMTSRPALLGRLGKKIHCPFLINN